MFLYCIDFLYFIVIQIVIIVYYLLLLCIQCFYTCFIGISQMIFYKNMKISHRWEGCKYNDSIKAPPDLNTALDAVLPQRGTKNPIKRLKIYNFVVYFI
jgi:hypothetical protein